MSTPLKAPSAVSADWTERRWRYAVRPRPKPKFKSILDAGAIFGAGAGETTVVERVRAAAHGEPCLTLHVTHELGTGTLDDRLACVDEGGLVCTRLVRVVTTVDGVEVRREEVDFRGAAFRWPAATYPDVLLPFLMRHQPTDGVVRSAVSWTGDRFAAHVYYESRGTRVIDAPAGAIRCVELWMYPDLNDWVPIGAVLARLAKPLLPRYTFWIEAAEPHRMVRFEGPYGPPGTPEVILDLLGDP